MEKYRIPPRRYREYMAAARKAKRQLSLEIGTLFKGVVQEGPLAGLQMTGEASWGSADAASMLLGLYEQQLFPYLTGHKRATLINIGAADGFWAVGLVRAGHFEKAVCFETRDQGQADIRQLANLNGVEDKITVYGEANDNFIGILAAEQAKGSTLVGLIDIEGAEYSLLTDTVLAILASSTVVIELHPMAVEDSHASENLIERARNFFHVETLTDSAKDLSAISKYFTIPDHLRYILVSEQRRYSQQWLALTPIGGYS